MNEEYHILMRQLSELLMEIDTIVIKLLDIEIEVCVNEMETE